MKVYFDKKVLVGFLIAFSILISLGIYSYRNSQDSIITSRTVSHTNDVLYRIEKLHSIHLEIEAELTRYVFTGDTAFAAFYRNKINDAREHYLALFELIKDNPALFSGIDSIRVLGMEKVNLINRVLNVHRQSPDSAQMIVFSSANRNLLKGINAAVESMQAEEKKQLDHRMEENQGEVTKFYTTFLTLLVATVFTIVVLFLLINTTLRARLQAEKALSKASEEVKSLYNEAPCGYHSINSQGLIIEMNKTWLKWIGYKREEVIGKMNFVELFTPPSQELYKETFPIFKSQGFISNAEFEVICKNGSTLFVILNATAIKDKNGNFIKSRSTAFNITDRRLVEEKVIAANKELEAFTYSVSHDLRAPLRSIDGYSKILQEDYSSTLDKEANRLLQIIRNNAHRMGHLIDDLLDFSRMGRKELDRTRVDMGALVQNVRQELVSQEQNRKIEFNIHPLQEALCDLSMMRQVWINLISNALKYSRKKEVSKIEIGCRQENNQTVYYIQDNGVGFDMKYSEKLFGVFQRLHKVEEFEGTGVGLALVHRIVSRHGGKIWAEASINEGSTFFFFIPSQNLPQ
ncbi:MAG TPA: ATP-binding protein [Chryseolinea sp.]